MLTHARLQQLGVRLDNARSLRFQCLRCGQCWSPMLGHRGRLPKGYWRCPNGCNRGDQATKRIRMDW